jgi:hypothetical protein
MENRSGKARILLLSIVTMGCAVCGFASDPQLPQPVAILDTTEILPTQRDLTFTTVAFSSETTIEVVACPTVRRDASCPFAVFHWENGELKHMAEAPNLDTKDATSSVNGKRLLFDFNDRVVSRLQHLFDNARMIWTFGMIAPEDVNREVVQVVDRVTRKSCFDWRRTFAARYDRRRSAAISPSGEFVAIKVEGDLSVYRLPSVCEGPRVTRRN